MYFIFWGVVVVIDDGRIVDFYCVFGVDVMILENCLSGVFIFYFV